MWIFIINEEHQKAHNSHTIQEYLKITVAKGDDVYNRRSHNGEELTGFPSAAQLKRFFNASRSVAFKDMLAPTPATMRRGSSPKLNPLKTIRSSAVLRLPCP